MRPNSNETRIDTERLGNCFHDGISIPRNFKFRFNTVHALGIGVVLSTVVKSSRKARPEKKERAGGILI